MAYPSVPCSNGTPGARWRSRLCPVSLTPLGPSYAIWPRASRVPGPCQVQPHSLIQALAWKLECKPPNHLSAHLCHRQPQTASSQTRCPVGCGLAQHRTQQGCFCHCNPCLLSSVWRLALRGLKTITHHSSLRASLLRCQGWMASVLN